MPTTFALYHLCLISITMLPDDAFSDFGDLGKQLLGGFVVAVVVAVAYTFIKMRLRDPKAHSQFISISSLDEPDEATKVSRE